MAVFTAGLNIQKPTSKSLARPRPAPKPSIFSQEDEDEDEDEDEVSGDGAAPSAPPHPSKPSKPTTRVAKTGGISPYGNLSSLKSATSATRAAEALDPAINDYDSFHTSRSRSQAHHPLSSSSSAPDPSRPQSQYMANLLASASVRKRDQQLAAEKILQRERAAEGDEFAGTERFVTGAYERHRAENRLLEAIEQKRLDAEQKKRQREGMGGFYRAVLEKESVKHRELVQEQEALARHQREGGSLQEPPPELSEADEEKQRLAELLARDPNAVEVNEDGRLVDKRQLLSAGLNCSKKPDGRHLQERNGSGGPAAAGGLRGPVIRPSAKQAHQDSRARQTKMLEEQLLQSLKRSAGDDDDEEGEEEVAKLGRSSRSDGDIGGARYRYSARKSGYQIEKSQGTKEDKG